MAKTVLRLSDLPELKHGDEGVAVQYLQALLTIATGDQGSWAHRGRKDAPDGVFGTGTHLVVQRVQDENGLDTTGVVNKDLWTVLFAPLLEAE